MRSLKKRIEHLEAANGENRLKVAIGRLTVMPDFEALRKAMAARGIAPPSCAETSEVTRQVAEIRRLTRRLKAD